MPRLGEKIPVKPEIKDALKNLTEQSQVAQAAFVKAASMMKDAHEDLWRLLTEAHPELLRDHHVTYNHVTHEMTVTGTRLSRDE